MVKLGVVDSPEGLRALESEWEALLPESGDDNVFLTFSWMWAWWEAFGEGARLHVLTVRSEDGALLAIAPMMAENVSRSRVMARAFSFIYNDNASHANFIIRKGRVRECLEVILSHFFSATRGEWDLLEFPSLVKDSEEYKVLLDILASKRCRFSVKRGLVSPFIDLTPFRRDWKAYVSSRSRRFKKHIKQWTGHDRKGAYSFEEILDTRNRPEAVREAREVSAASWKARCLRHIDSSSENGRFFELLCDAASRKGWLRLWMLRLRGKPLAFDFQMAYKDTISALRSDFDESHAQEKTSPGCLLQMHILREYIERGCREYDFCGDNDRYKSSWVDRVREHGNVTVYNNTPAAFLIYTWDYRLVYRLKECLKKYSFFRKVKRMMVRGKA